MYPPTNNLVQQVMEGHVVENAGRSAMRSMDEELGQRFTTYHTQLGNLQATGYALAADLVLSRPLRQGMAVLSRAIARLFSQVRPAKPPAQPRVRSLQRTTSGR